MHNKLVDYLVNVVLCYGEEIAISEALRRPAREETPDSDPDTQRP